MKIHVRSDIRSIQKMCCLAGLLLLFLGHQLGFVVVFVHVISALEHFLGIVERIVDTNSFLLTLSVCLQRTIILADPLPVRHLLVLV